MPPTTLRKPSREALSGKMPDITQQIMLMTEDPDRALVASNNIECWITTLQLHSHDAFVNDAHRTTFQTLISSRRFDDAEQVLSHLPEAERPELLATIRYYQNRWPQALDILQQHGLQHLAAEWTKSIVPIAMSIAERKHENQQFEDAIYTADQVLAIIPGHIAAMELRIRSFQHMPNFAAAIAAANLLLKQNPEHRVARHVKARLLARMGNLAEAISTIEEILDQHPNYHQALADYALILANADRSEQGIPLIKRAIELCPKPNSDYHGFLANIHADVYIRHSSIDSNPTMKRMHRSAAIRAASNSMEIDPTSVPATAALIRLFVSDGYKTLDGPAPTDELYKIAERFHFFKPSRATKNALTAAEDFAAQWHSMTEKDQPDTYPEQQVEFDDLWALNAEPKSLT